MPEQSDAETWQCPLEALSLTDTYTALGTQPQGLTHAEAAARLQRYGRNTIDPVETTPLVRKFLANFTHLMALLLWVGACSASCTDAATRRGHLAGEPDQWRV